MQDNRVVNTMKFVLIITGWQSKFSVVVEHPTITNVQDIIKWYLNSEHSAKGIQGIEGYELYSGNDIKV